MAKLNKGALSPVVATSLLIALVVVLAMIVFLFARGFIPEYLEKEDRPIEDKCKDVIFSGDYSGGTITVRNGGNTPLNGIKLGIKTLTGFEFIEDFTAIPSIRAEDVRTFQVTADLPASGELIIVPVLLGKNKDGIAKAFVCDESYGQPIGTI